VLIIAVAYSVFHESRFQKKSFKSGEGEMSDVIGADFQSSGRFTIWEKFRDRIEDEPWFGYGVGAGENYVREITMGMSGYPHNDWLLTAYDYGYVGTVLYALTLLAAALHAFGKGKKTTGLSRSLFYAGSLSFIPYAMIMYTDNIMVYASYYGNLQLTLLGLAYASVRPKKRSFPWKKVRW
jgi:O-antigen ligase